MKEYEIIREIINLCPGNHTRDTFIEEAELPDDADLEAYVRDKFKNEAELKIERIDREDGQQPFIKDIRFRNFKGRIKKDFTLLF